MAETPDNPKLKLEFSGDAFVAGRVPLSVVADKLQALQKLLYHAAAAIEGDSTARRGQWFNKYRDTAELSFASSHHSDLVIEAELAPNPVLGEAFDTGRQAVDLVFDFGGALLSDARSDQPQAVELSQRLSKDDRRYLLRAFEGLMPNTTDQYVVSLQNCNAETHPQLRLTPYSRQLVRRLAMPIVTTSRSEETLVGELIKIHIDAGDDKITLRYGSREVDCFYPDALRDQVANLMAGSMVEVVGYATLNAEDQVVKLTDVIDIDTVSLDPLRVSRFEHGGVRYALIQPVTLQVDYKDGFWVYSNESLNLWGYAERREDALHDLHESFDYLYRQIALEADENLDGVAQRLKADLLALVPTPPQTADAASPTETD